MKRKAIIFVLFIWVHALGAQVFNNSQTIPPGLFELSIHPSVFSGNEYILFLHGGYGIGNKMDLGFHIGSDHFNLDDMYLGMDIEWMIKSKSPFFSLTLGMHHNGGSFGLDGILNFGFPVIREGITKSQIYFGLDLDVVFIEGERKIPLWLFAGVEFLIKRDLSIAVEFALGANEEAANIISFGMHLYL